MTDSFLERRLGELEAGEQAVPLEYEALREAALDQLPAVVEVVADDSTVLLDSGVRGGAAAFKALALGADGVLLGRPFVYGLAAAGQRGVYETVLNCLAERESVMALSGRPEIEKIGPDALTLTRFGTSER